MKATVLRGIWCFLRWDETTSVEMASNGHFLHIQDDNINGGNPTDGEKNRVPVHFVHHKNHID